MLAKELAALRPGAILCRATPVAKALFQETSEIPIVFVNVSDPVGDGLVASLARPGGNVTGFTNVEDSLGGKWLELLKEIDPAVERVAVIFDPKTSPGGGTYYVRQINQAAALHLTAIPTMVTNAVEIEQAADAAAREPNSSLLVLPDVTTTSHRDLITTSATRRRLPAVYSSGYFVKGGGLISYASKSRISTGEPPVTSIGSCVVQNRAICRCRSRSSSSLPSISTPPRRLG